MYVLIGKLFPAMLGAIISPLSGKSYIIGEDDQTYHNNIWFLCFHSKMMEWIIVSGKIWLTDDIPLENQICFEKYYLDKLLYCTQCSQLGHHQ